MSRARNAWLAVLSAGLGSLVAGCPTTYVTLGSEASAGNAGIDYSCNAAGVGADPCFSAAGMGGIAGTIYGTGGSIGGVGGASGAAGIAGSAGVTAGTGGAAGVSGGCAPSDATLQSCASYLPFGDMPNDVYGYNACLNGGDGVGGNGADQCEGYAPCSYQHEECLFYRTDGAAGSTNLGCAGAPGDDVWLEDCGGSGYYGSDIVDPITGGAGGAGGAGGSGGVAGQVAGASGGAGMTAGAGGVGGVGGEAGATGGEGGS